MLKGLNRNAIWISAFINHGLFTILTAILLSAALYAITFLRFTPFGQTVSVFVLNALAQTAFGKKKLKITIFPKVEQAF